MTDHAGLRERLKRLGFARDRHIRLYGETFELIGDPVVLDDQVVFVEAIEKNSRELRRVFIPLIILSMVTREQMAA
jgi:hypothetical protein